jgi:hypothetical protein
VPFDEIREAIVEYAGFQVRAFRPQGFSPSRRLCPACASRLCFTPLPPIGFSTFRAFPTRPVVAPLDARNSLTVSDLDRSRFTPPPIARIRAERSPRFRSFAPTECPTPLFELFTRTAAAALVAFIPSEVYGAGR